MSARIPWSDGVWTREPVAVEFADGAMLATAAEGSDAWRTTAYGFVHDDEHALLAPFAVGEAIEVTFRAPWTGEFDHAGAFISVADDWWVKTGLELADGHLGLGAVVTRGASDWSIGWVDDWADSVIGVRVSRWPDALIIRARAGDDPWRLVRVVPFAVDGAVAAGPFLCGPTRAGFTVEFLSWTRGPADESVH